LTALQSSFKLIINRDFITLLGGAGGVFFKPHVSCNQYRPSSEEHVAQTKPNTIVDQMHEMKQRMDVLFAESFKAEEVEMGFADAPPPSEPWLPSMDVWEGPHAWLFIADLPGVADQDLGVEIEGGQLTVRGIRKTSIVRKEMKALQLQRLEGVFLRTFSVPCNIRAEAIKAELKHGVLTVTVPKDPGSHSGLHRVMVRAG
jgi:HSP20 family protein